ncbi:MAG TPA: choline/ethanolamine kinase family protein [Gaiellaceae bacterium]|nr:choline/ethanolamine kinase family protein [Gaiellaceae bacterium]
MRVEEMVERVWPGRSAEIEVLGGGITNRNFKVTLDDGAYVLRIGGNDTELLGIDRRVEYEASLAAAAVGVGPEVVAFVEPEGYLVTRFIGGAVVGPEVFREPEALRRIAQSLHAVHAGPPIAARFDSFRVVEAYAATATTRGVVVPPAYERARATAALVERARGPVPERPATTTCSSGSSAPPRSARSGRLFVSAGGGGPLQQRLRARARRPSPRS